jgi:hypothetical protein
MLAVFGDAPSSVARGCSMALGCAHMKRVADDGEIGCFERRIDQALGIAGKDRGERCMHEDAGRAQRPDGAQPFVERGAVGLIQTPDVVAVGGEGETDT